MLKKFILILLAAWFVMYTGCSSGKKGTDSTNTPAGQVEGELDYTREAEQQLLDSTFRIDIETIDVLFNYFPDAGEPYVECNAILVFRMRPGQTRPIVHLEPAVKDTSIVGNIFLDGESLDISNQADVRIVDFPLSSQKALEFQRNLEENQDHRLTISYLLKPSSIGTENYPRFSSQVNDIHGRGNELVFPTINSPHELARHFITFWVQSETPYNLVGSGRLNLRPPPFFNQWSMDTEQEVASYTVMFVLLPFEDTVQDKRNIDGVDVRVVAYVGGASIDKAFSKLESCLPEFRDTIGPFPMPRGLNVFLTQTGGGMEYYGATISSLSALEHEVFHMYFGCSVINKTYRDSWLDEAINMWYEYSKNSYYTRISDFYRSDIVCGRSPIEVGFDSRAYDQGAHIIQAVAEELGGREQMLDFLRYLYSGFTFSPFTTVDFLDYLEKYSGHDMKQQFLNWLYYKMDSSSDKTSTSRTTRLHMVDLTPPYSLLKKYRKKN